MEHCMDLTGAVPKKIENLTGFWGENPNGETISFTNYYMQKMGKPHFGISGEIHFSRLWEERWEDALLKMKAGGINTIATYVFWIHHEEKEGSFHFEGRRNIRRFAELCGKHGLDLIVRIGPFDHGEVRNGGLPDWLYGKPFEVRSLDEGFLECTRRWYAKVAEQLKGLYYKDGGPIIAAQIDNEYMHSSAPWEITTGISGEWLTSGNEGDKYMLRLLEIAKEEGIETPFYTCTGWGGASTPEEFMPLWGGYAFRPWIFYSYQGEHPATEEYIYRDNHNNEVPATYNFEPFYQPESRPYLCCEMGGGMTCSYYYRFQLPYESVDAMSNIKLGSGCNMLGYYMYHGGTNPKTAWGGFLNEGQVPKLSYDYQAALGEFGQVRESFRRLRTLHQMIQTWEEVFCPTKTFLPENSQEIQPEDTETLRYAVRLNANESGFLFLNNYQDHTVCKPKTEETVRLGLQRGEVCFDKFSLAAGENCVLPFHLDIGGVHLVSSLAQPITTLEHDGETYAFFFAPEGMIPRYDFAEGTKIETDSNRVKVEEKGLVRVSFEGEASIFCAEDKGNKVRFVTLTREQSLLFDVIQVQNKRYAVLSEGVSKVSGKEISWEFDESQVHISIFPDARTLMKKAVYEAKDGIFTSYVLKKELAEYQAEWKQVGPSRYCLEIPEWTKSDVKEMLLQINYVGDIGQAFIGGEMISDNFANGAVWEIGLKEFADRLEDESLTLYIVPIKKDSKVNVESVMAGRREETGQILAALNSIKMKPVYEWKLS